MPSGQQDFSSDVFEAWRSADKAARSAEDAVRMAFLHALDGHGDPPAPEERERAKACERMQIVCFRRHWMS